MGYQSKFELRQGAVKTDHEIAHAIADYSLRSALAGMLAPEVKQAITDALTQASILFETARTLTPNDPRRAEQVSDINQHFADIEERLK